MGFFFTPLDQVMSSAGKVRLLRALSATGSPVSGREAADAAGIAVQPAQRALAELVTMGVVRREQTRSQHLYTLNRENYLVQSLTPLFRVEEERVARVFAELGRLGTGELRSRIEGLYLYGSAARGEDRIGSDFDVLAVAATAGDVNRVHEALAEHAEQLYTRHGLRLSAVVIDQDKLRTMHDDGDPLIRELSRDNRRITGKRLELVIHGHARKQKGS
jgi:predicted nucleotidyltransferase